MGSQKMSSRKAHSRSGICAQVHLAWKPALLTPATRPCCSEPVALACYPFFSLSINSSLLGFSRVAHLPSLSRMWDRSYFVPAYDRQLSFVLRTSISNP